MPGQDLTGPWVGLVDAERVRPVDVPDIRTLFDRGVENVELVGDAPDVALTDVKLHPPIVPKRFFHTAGNFREHHDEGKKAGWSHDIAPRIVFFQNVDALIGNGDEVVYPKDLTNELDYELELAVVIARSGKWFDVEGRSPISGVT